MAIIGYNVTKIEASKDAPKKGKVSIRNNIQLIDVKETEMNGLGNEQKSLLFSFRFTSDYDPKIGNIKIEGNVSTVEKTEEADKILKDWQEKNLDKNVRNNILNVALNRCNVTTILLSREVGLPSPIPMPKLKN